MMLLLLSLVLTFNILDSALDKMSGRIDYLRTQVISLQIETDELIKEVKNVSQD